MSRQLQPADLTPLSGCGAEMARAFVALDSDIALLIDNSGVVTQVVQKPEQPLAPGAEAWVGRPWADSVDDDSRIKIEKLFADAVGSGLSRRRQVNHADTPVSYAAMRLGAQGPVLAVGRDLREVAALQQRFVSHQQGAERHWWHSRQGEARLRALHRVATDAVLVADAASRRIVRANGAATALLRAEPAAPLPGQLLQRQFDARSWPPVAQLIASVLSDAGAADYTLAEVPARLAASHTTVTVSAAAFASPQGPRVLLRVRTPGPAGAEATLPGGTMAQRVDGSDEGLVLTDAEGRVLLANLALVRWLQAPSEESLRGQPVGQWLLEPVTLGHSHDSLSARPPGQRVRREGLLNLQGLLLRREGGVVPLKELEVALFGAGAAPELGLVLRLDETLR